MITQTKSFYQVSRRKLLGYAGMTSGILILGSACKKDDDSDSNDGINLGNGDIGILNYAYALEQLEAAFYTQVIDSLYSGITEAETDFLTDIRDHEIIHREFFKALIGKAAIQNLEFNFSSIDFSKRESVLAAAKDLEDLGVSAYNGASQLIQNVNNLLLIGKIISVEARHAALIRNLISNGTFADSSVVDDAGLDIQRTPDAVLAIAGTYIKTKINGNNLPRP